MEAKKRLLWFKILYFVGGVLCVGWVLVSLLGLFDAVPTTGTPWKAFSALGPLGIVLMVLGNALCGWNLSALRREIETEEQGRDSS